MKTLNKKREIKAWTLKVECTGLGNRFLDDKLNDLFPCEKMLELNINDIFITTTPNHMGNKQYYSFKCCNCGCTTDIPEDKLPEFVKNFVKEKFNKQQAKQNSGRDM